MKKHSMMAAAALLAAGASHAQTSNVALYGYLNVDLESVKSGSTPSVTRLTNNSSYLGFRGEEDLGGGMRALFQIESAVSADTGAGTVAGRNTGVGLSGNAGTVLLGQWDTPYKAATIRLDPFTDKTIAGYGAVLYGDASKTAANTESRNSFDRRQRNVIQYWSPNVAGFSGRLAHGVSEEKGSCAVACAPKLWSLAAGYEQGPLYLTMAYERHDEYANSAKAQTRDQAFKAGGSYVLGNTTLSVLAERLRYAGNLGATGLPKTYTVGNANDATLTTLWMGASHKIGASTLRLALGRTQDVKLDQGSAPGTSARYVALGYAYTLSKRTEAYATFVKIHNGANSRNDFAINSADGVKNGASPQGAAIGLVHSF